ncbi:polysaccharide biosynthesis/export family protein [Flavobacterium sp. XS2P12]|uniref:polysaccharide biosynthesis/export family protein n=1 Tax=Flavobacterium melibiosi TaxID=3398734 RepID=UPI003A8552A8
MIKPQKKILILILGILIISSCASKKDLIYFSDVNLNEHDKTIFSEGKIQANDILSIIVSSSSPDLASMYNTNQPTSSAINGYLVTMDDTVTLPILGKIEVKDLTIIELENFLVKKLIDGNHLVNPTVTVRLTNAKFTILGEVKSPGTYTFNEQNISILQALGYAGDLTIHGKRQNILIIREEDHKRTYTTIDLTSKKWFDSPSYYIKPNDVIYVNPNGSKITSSGYIPSLGNLLAIVSIAITTFLLVTK